MSVHDADPLHELRRKFEEAAEKNEEGVQCIIEPELADLVALLTNEKDKEVDESGLREILVSKEWESKSLTWQEICELQTMLSSPALPSVESSLVPDLKSAVGTESEPALLEPNRELQQLVAANIPIPQKLMCAMNQFAVVARNCNSLATTNAHIEKQKSTSIKNSEFMSTIVALVSQENLSWDYICGCDTSFRDFAKILWSEWIALIKRKYTTGAEEEVLQSPSNKIRDEVTLEHAAKLIRTDPASCHDTERHVDSSDTAHSSAMQSLMDLGLSSAATPTLKDCEWISARAVLTEQNEGCSYKFQGMLVDYDEEARNFSINDSAKRPRSDAKIPSQVRNIKCLDGTGPANIILWGESCEDFERALQATVLSAASIKKWFFTIERVRVSPVVSNSANGNILTPMRSIQSIAASSVQSTTIAITTMATSPFLLHNAIYTAPKPPFCIMNFQQARMQFVVPFRATLRGSTIDIVKDDFTRTGEPKTSFSLVDSSGAWLNCCAIGVRNACSNALFEGSEIVAYNVYGRGALQAGQQSLVWLFKDATIVSVGKSSVKKHLKIDLVAAQK